MDTAEELETLLRHTVNALLLHTGESQADLALALGMHWSQVSRRLHGHTPWSVGDLARVAAHYQLPAPDLLKGPTRRTGTLGGTQTLIPLP